jgi:hypothetical protein
MTIETRYFIGLDDFIGFEITCLHCKSKALFPVGKINVLVACPSCSKPWFNDEKDSRREKVNEFFWAIHDVQKLAKRFKPDGINIAIRFELADNHAATL